MRLFLRRLDRFIEHTIDWDLIAPSGKPAASMKLKVIFDNLRYYPLLGLLVVVAKALVSDGAWGSVIAALVLGLMTFILGILVMIQSSAIYTATVVPALSMLMPQRTAVRARAMLRRSSLALYLFSAVLMSCWGFVGWRLLLFLTARGF